MSASPAPVDLPPAVAEWRAAIERLPADASPCRHLPPPHWTAIRENCLDFIDRFGVEAHRLGWTASQLFGVHPKYGTIRAEWCGALMVHRESARGVEFARVVFEWTSAHRGKQDQRDGTPVWEFAKRDSWSKQTHLILQLIGHGRTDVRYARVETQGSASRALSGSRRRGPS